MRARLLAWAKERGIQFQYASMLYMQEGILSRLAASVFADSLVLKGGFLIFAHAGSAGRTTKDLDFLGQGISNDEKALAEIIAQVVCIEQGDGLSFDSESISTERITEGADYHGVRVVVECRLGALRNRLQIDIGFGDAVSPAPSRFPIPGMLGRLPIVVSAYPLASVIAEKFEVMIALGSVNSRMKDFFDVAYLLENYDIPDNELLQALNATFTQRHTEMPEYPAVFSTSFAASQPTQALWNGFLSRSQLATLELTSVMSKIRERLYPLYEELRSRR